MLKPHLSAAFGPCCSWSPPGKSTKPAWSGRNFTPQGGKCSTQVSTKVAAFLLHCRNDVRAVTLTVPRVVAVQTYLPFLLSGASTFTAGLFAKLDGQSLEGMATTPWLPAAYLEVLN